MIVDMRARRGAAAALGMALITATPAVAAGPAAPPDRPPVPVAALAETPAVPEDNADDPAIWVNPQDPGRSLVVGALKDEGLGVYDLQGRLVQRIAPQPTPEGAEAPSRFNNVDLVRGFPLGGRRVDLAVVSDRGLDRVRAYRIDPGNPAAPLTDVSAADLPFVFSRDLAEAGEQSTAYGLTTWSDRHRTYVYVTQRHSLPVAQLELVARDGRVTYRKVSSVTLPGGFRLPDGTSWTPCQDPGEQPQSEAMVVDPAARALYVAQEDVGIWRVPVPFGRGAPRLLDRVRSFGVPAAYDPATEECVAGGADPGFGGRHLTADVEGLEVVPRRRGGPVLLASSQGDNTFAVYGGGGTRYLGGFRVPDGAIDGSSDCDGLAVTPLPLGPAWPGGLAVVQDGDDRPAGESSNFKFVPWRPIAEGVLGG